MVITTMRSFRSIASLHAKSIKTGFISKLGILFLSTLYQSISECPNSIVFASIDDNKRTTGFIAGALSTKKMYRWILIRFGFVFFIQLALKAFNPSVLKKILETAVYSFKKKNNINESSPDRSIEAELLSIAVDSSDRGKGLGKKLVGDLENWFREKGVTGYKTVTFSKDSVSNQFYLSCGFILSRSFKHHGNILNEYTKTIHHKKQ